jgi:hypothetical protein
LGAVKEDLSYFLIVFKVHIRELTYKLTIFQALDVYQEEMTHYINLMNYRHNKELQSQNVGVSIDALPAQRVPGCPDDEIRPAAG